MADGIVKTGGGEAAPDAGMEAEFTALREALALERAKNEVLLEQILKTEDALLESDVGSFSDVIPNEDREFWRGQLLENREAAVGILERMRNRGSGAEAGAVPAAPARPLHNRETARPACSEAAVGAGGVDKAAKLRNRAQEIARRDGCSFTAAFRLAEQESGEVR